MGSCFSTGRPLHPAPSPPPPAPRPISPAAAARGQKPTLPPSGQFNPKLVIGIDFGTAATGVAWRMTNVVSGGVAFMPWKSTKGGDGKVRTNLLLDRNRKPLCFGDEAHDKYHSERDDSQLFFEKFKMKLIDKGSTDIKAANGISVPAVTVVAAALQLLRGMVLEKLSDHGLRIPDEDIRWVITVPAKWTGQAKHIMRKAADQAGFYDYTCQLKLALEPEAASLACRKDASVTSHPRWKAGVLYMVLDCGGGTVDITVHKLNDDGTISEKFKPGGGPWGSTYVDEQFWDKIMCACFGAECMNRWRRENPRAFITFMRCFEEQKCAYSFSEHLHSFVSLPRSLRAAVLAEHGISPEDKLAAWIDSNELENSMPVVMNSEDPVAWDKEMDGMLLHPEVMAFLITPMVDLILTEVERILGGVGGVAFLFLVGGFASNTLLESRVRAQFGKQVIVKVPDNPGLSVLVGAVLFGLDPQSVPERVAQKTYGMATQDFYKPEHELAGRPRVKRKHGKEEVDTCQNIFRRFVTCGESVRLNQPRKIEFPVPACCNALNVIIYETELEDPGYTDNKACTRIASMRLNVTASDTEQKVHVIMNFGDTELTVTAFSDGEAPRTVQLDFDSH